MNSNARPDPLLEFDAAVDHLLGAKSAPVSLIEYGDFECPSCRQAHPAVKIMLAHFGDKVNFVFRHFPLREVHPHAELAAEASEAAGAQHKFWAYHDLLFAHSQHLESRNLFDYAEQIALDMPRFRNEMEDRLYLQRVQEQVESGRHVGVRATPAIYVNGVFSDVSFGMQHLRQSIEKALANAAS